MPVYCGWNTDARTKQQDSQKRTMGMCFSVAKVRDDVEVNVDYLSSLPTELLVKIFSYLPTRNKITMRHISRRFRDVSEVPLLWKEFAWRDFEPHHVSCCVNNTVKRGVRYQREFCAKFLFAVTAYGEHTRRIFFPKHATSVMILVMMHYCKNVTHLSLPACTQLSLNQLQNIVHTRKSLQQLDVFICSKFVCENRTVCNIIGLLRITAANVKKLILRVKYDRPQSIMDVLSSIQEYAKQGYPLPLINIITENDEKIDFLFNIWSTSSSKWPSVEVSLFDKKKVPMNLYTPMPLRKFTFGPSSTPPFIQLGNYGITGLKFDIFYISKYI